MAFLAPIHRDGYKFIALFFFSALILWKITPWLGVPALILTFWCAYFFRNPKRIAPMETNAIVAPADGIVSLIQEVTPPESYALSSKKRWRVSIFLNVFDVHVQRIPQTGIISNILYHPGKFLNASLDKASDENERQTIILQTPHSRYAITQIAGLIARRIRCDVEKDQSVKQGEVYGLIRFGSRVDVYLPDGVKPRVSLGQRMIGGETIIAYEPIIKEEEPLTAPSSDQDDSAYTTSHFPDPVNIQSQK